MIDIAYVKKYGLKWKTQIKSCWVLNTSPDDFIKFLCLVFFLLIYYESVFFDICFGFISGK